MSGLIVLGIDPGIANVGFGIVVRHRTKIVKMYSGTLITTPRRATEHRIYSIARRIDYLIRAVEPDVVVIEDFTPTPGMGNRRNLHKISRVFGAIIYVVQKREVELVIPRPNIWMRRFMSLGKVDKFTKTDIRKLLRREYGIRAEVEHEAEAIAMAITRLEGRI